MAVKAMATVTIFNVDDVDNLEVGGRNLVYGTKNWDDSAFYINGNYGPSSGTIADGVLSVPRGNSQIDTHYVDVEVGAEYTVSVDIRSTAAYTGNSVLLQYYDAEGTRLSYIWVTSAVAEQWNRMIYTFTIPENTVRLRIGLRSSSGYVNSYRLLKLEKGNVATDWTPAPEDVESKITTLEDNYSTVSQTMEGITARVGSMETTTEGLSTQMTAAESSITQQAEEISSKVSKDGIISTINQTAEEVKIQADKINLDGTVLVSGSDGEVTIADGSVTAGKLLADQALVEKIISNSINTTSLRLNANNGTQSCGINTTVESDEFAVRMYSQDGEGNRAELVLKNDEAGELRYKYNASDEAVSSVKVAPELVTVRNDTRVNISAPEIHLTGGTTYTGALAVTGRADVDGSIYSTNGVVAANGYGFYSYTASNTLVRLCYISASNNFWFGNANYPTLLYGSSITANKSISTSSDRRLKHDIRPVESRYDSLLDQLNAVTYRYNDCPEREHMGLIYQDVKGALEAIGITDSALVSEDANGMGGIAYTELIALLVAETQKLKARVDALENGG